MTSNHDYAAEVLNNNDFDFEVVTLLSSDKILSICYAEITRMIENNQIVKKCNNCGLYFTPTKRIDETYCDRVVKILANGTQRTCKDIGPLIKYAKKTNNDPIIEIYRRAYKTYHSRIKAKGKSNISKKEFYDWKTEAEKKMEGIRQGKITIEEFRDWVKNGEG